MRKTLYVILFIFNIIFAGLFLALGIVTLKEFIRVVTWDSKWKAISDQIVADLKEKFDSSSLPRELAQTMASKGVPPRPTSPLYGTWKGFLGVNLVWLALISIGVLTLIFFWNNRSSI